MTVHRWTIELGDSEYPDCLACTDRPPTRLHGIGDPSLLTPGLAVIGSRRATPYGLDCSQLFAGWAAGQGIVVVSGAAMGCDLAAHRAALRVGGPTVAVLGCGADVDYPRESAGTLSRIREYGCVVSEFDWGSGPTRWAFPRRNRIIAALSHAVLVVEASLPSGTFSTADHALDAGRQVLAVPGSIHAPECLGSNRLLCQGATPVTDVSDLAAALGVLGTSGRPNAVPSGAVDDGPVFSAVRVSPMRPDDLGRALDMDVVAVARELGRLESAGLVVRFADGRYGARVRPGKR